MSTDCKEVQKTMTDLDIYNEKYGARQKESHFPTAFESHNENGT